MTNGGGLGLGDLDQERWPPAEQPELCNEKSTALLGTEGRGVRLIVLETDEGSGTIKLWGRAGSCGCVCVLDACLLIDGKIITTVY